MQLFRWLCLSLLISASAVGLSQVAEQDKCELAKKNLEQSSEVDVHETPVAAGRLAGRLVVQGQGEPLSGAIVELLVDNGKTCSSAVLSDAHGRFHFPKVQRGRYSVRISKPGFNTAELKYLVQPGARQTPVITITPGH